MRDSYTGYYVSFPNLTREFDPPIPHQFTLILKGRMGTTRPLIFGQKVTRE